MEKLAYILFKEPSDSSEACCDGLLGHAAPAILAMPGTRGLTMEIADLADDERVTPNHLMGRGQEIGAAVFVWLDSLDERAKIEAVLSDFGAGLAGYLVTESQVQPYARRSRPDGERSPGVSQFVTFPQPAELTDEEFFARWHDGVSKMSFQLHPTRLKYERNVVARILTPGAPPWRGIVSERWASLEEWLDPEQLYSSQELFDEMQALAFADPEAVNLTLTSEWIMRSWDG